MDRGRRLGRMLAAMLGLLMLGALALAATRAPTLHPIARSPHFVSLIQGPGSVAVAGDDVWARVRDGKLANDPAMARALAAAAAKLPEGDTHHLAWGRTPIVMNDVDDATSLVRPGDPKPIKGLGAAGAVVLLGADREVVLSARRGHSRLSIVDKRGHITRLAALPSIGPSVPGIRAGMRGDPQAFRIVGSGSDVVALIVECHMAAPLRLETIHPDGRTEVRRLASAESAGHLQVEEFALTSRGVPVVASGEGTLRLARAGSDGAWSVTQTSIHSAALAEMAIGTDDAVWTITTADGRATLARDGVVVELRDPTGKLLQPNHVAVDARLGIVVSAGGDPFQDPTWIFAEHLSEGDAVELK